MWQGHQDRCSYSDVDTEPDVALWQIEPDLLASIWGIILNMGLANEKRRYICNVVSDWLSPYPEWSLHLSLLLLVIPLHFKRHSMRFNHHHDVIMSAMASQITGVSIVCSAVYSGADQRKHQSSASLAFVRGIHRWPVDSPHNGPATRKMFPFDGVIMNHVECIEWQGTMMLYQSWFTLTDHSKKVFMCGVIFITVVGMAGMTDWSEEVRFNM